MSAWLDLAEAQAQLLALAPTMLAENIRLEDALGRVLGADLTAHRTQPPADLSAMDGYAIAGSSPWELVGESRCGAPFAQTIATGQAVRISTGAHMPAGAQTVLIQENATREGASISADEVPPAGKHIRKRGFDFEAGDTLLTKGTVLGPAQIALAMAGGYAEVAASKQPTVAVLDSGDELAADPSQCADDQIPASNGAMIAGLLAPLIGSPKRVGPVKDSMEALAEALSQTDDCDIVITTGGASVGDHDLIQDALREWGAKIAFWKVAIKPGKPLMVATRERNGGSTQVILGLPGNPVSSFVTAHLFALPLLRASLGIANPLAKTIPMTAGEPLPATGLRQEFLRGVHTGNEVHCAPSQDSSALRSLAEANCLIVRPANAPAIEAGDTVEVYLL